MHRFSLRILITLCGLSLFSIAPARAQEPAGSAQPSSASQTLSSGELSALVAPIALYPDPLLANVIMASTYPLEVVVADRFMKANKNLKGDSLKRAVEKKGWDKSVAELTATPDVLAMMSEKIEWTRKLGDAVVAQQNDVMDAVQSLRARAEGQNKLTTTKEQKVYRQRVDNKDYIVIEPAQANTMYVPYYDPGVVYGAWPYPDYPAYYWSGGYGWGYYGGAALATGIAFGAGWALASWGNWWGGGWDWHHHHVHSHHHNNNKWAHNKERGGRNHADRNRGANNRQAADRGRDNRQAGNRDAGGNRDAANRGKGGNKQAQNRRGGNKQAQNRQGANKQAQNRKDGNKSAHNRGSSQKKAAQQRGGQRHASKSPRGNKQFSGGNRGRSFASARGGGRSIGGGRSLSRGGFGGGRGGRGGRRSDIRVKDDIALLGYLPNGLGYYRFSYNGGDRAYVGVMAQEVQPLMPEAVQRDRDGVLRVRYDKLGIQFQTYEEWLRHGARIPRAASIAQ